MIRPRTIVAGTAAAVIASGAFAVSALASASGDDSPNRLSSSVSTTPSASSESMPTLTLDPVIPLLPDDTPSHDVGDDKGGQRPAGVSDDGPSHDVGDDKGGQRPAGVSDDGPSHDLGDDHGGDRDRSDRDDDGHHRRGHDDSRDDRGGHDDRHDDGGDDSGHHGSDD
jgi:hypothetical protein